MAATDEMATTRLTLEELQETFDFIRGCSDRTYKRTPLLSHWKDTGDCAELSRQCHLYLKLENMQTTGTCPQSRFFVSLRFRHFLFTFQPRLLYDARSAIHIVL